MDMMQKLTILSGAAKYDVSCASSGTERSNTPGGVGNAAACGICHSFAADGRCISLFKILMTNVCVYDCAYCQNRRSNDVPRAVFTPREVADLTIGFYRRNYIEGLFLSSGVLRSPDYTCERLIETLSILRNEYRFGGYIHAKAIPGASRELIEQLGLLADRMSVNIELPSSDSLRLLAPDKSRAAVLGPMGAIQSGIRQNSEELVKYRGAPRFVPAGQSTQMIVGATPESDLKIISLSERLYGKYRLKRVYYSAYVPVSENPLLPAADVKPPLLREHRLYQADWLLRFYGFTAGELLSEQEPNFNPLVDPKCNWAIRHPELFPVEVNRAPYEMLLRVPGIGVTGAKRIVSARRMTRLDFAGLKKLGVVLKRAQYFILCAGHTMPGLRLRQDRILEGLLSDKGCAMYAQGQFEQLSLFDHNRLLTGEDVRQCISGQL